MRRDSINDWSRGPGDAAGCSFLATEMQRYQLERIQCFVSNGECTDWRDDRIMVLVCLLVNDMNGRPLPI